MENTTTLEVPGITLEVTTVPFEPVTQYTLLAEVGKVLVPTVLAARGVAGQSDALDLMPACRALFEQLTPDFARQAMQHILAGTTVVRRAEGEQPVKLDLVDVKSINRAFAGAGLKPLLLAIKHALEVNYGRFFVGSGGNASASIPATPSH